MKKIIALLLAAIMVLSLAACASKTEPATDTTTAEPAAEPAETTEEGKNTKKLFLLTHICQFSINLQWT